MSAHAPAVSVRKLLAIFVALSVLFAPAVARAAVGGTPDHELMMEQTGHCQMPVSGSADHGKMAGTNCCIWMCAAVAICPTATLREEPAQLTPAVSAIPTFDIGYLGEIATPPPRRA